VSLVVAIAALLIEECDADDLAFVVFRPMAAVFLHGLASILADLATGLGCNLIDARHSRSLFYPYEPIRVVLRVVILLKTISIFF
jgi:hypothetical protein